MGSIFNIFLVLALMSLPVDNFKTEQKKQSRVKAAYKDKESTVKSYVAQAGLDYSTIQVYLRALKDEKKLEVYGKDQTHKTYQLIHTYDFCRFSGTLGPKRKRGDGQVPEGLYHIDRFNPWSNFHLSLGINYPNKSDQKKSKHSNLGGDIFIHGNCVTIGCIPITDDKIKELYILCVEAKNNGQNKIPVHIFPFNMTEMADVVWKSNGDSELRTFWINLKEAFDDFESNKGNVAFKIDDKGDYQIL